MPFTKGQSGNPSGRKRNSFMTDALLIEIKDRERSEDKGGLRKLAKTVVSLAEAGDMRAVEFIRDTLDGKPRQQVEFSGDEDNPLRFITRIELTSPK